jgi:hypothetical protein
MGGGTGGVTGATTTGGAGFTTAGGSGGVTGATTTGGAGFATDEGGGAGGVTGATTTGGAGFVAAGGGNTVAGGLCACAGVSVFKSAGRGFGNGGATRGTTACVTGAAGLTGNALGGTVTGSAELSFGFVLGLCFDVALNFLHFDDGIFAQSCRLIRFRLCSMPCTKDLACTGRSIAFEQTKTAKPARATLILMTRSSHSSRVYDNDQVGKMFQRLFHRNYENARKTQQYFSIRLHAIVLR